MTATDELRRLLDERGVEYTVVPEDAYSREYIKIGNIEILTNGRDEVAVYYLTPEQAVDATLGSDLKAENEKLRELLRDTIPYVDCHLGSDECIHMHECHGGNGCVFDRLARELGVDV